MIIRTAAAALAVDPGEVRVVVEQRSGLPCRGTLDDELAAGNTVERACRWPLTLPSWRATCTCFASGVVGARRSGRVRIGRTAPGATSASTRSSCSMSTATAEVACGHRCSVWSRPRTGSGWSKPRIAVWPVDPRRTGRCGWRTAQLSPPPWARCGRRSCRDCCLASLDPGVRCDSLTGASGADLEHRPASGCVEVR